MPSAANISTTPRTHADELVRAIISVSTETVSSHRSASCGWRCNATKVVRFGHCAGG
jgi:hypothetical protein